MTESNAPELELVETPENERAEPAAPPRTLTEAPEDIRMNLIGQVYQMIVRGQQTEDYIREVRVHPEDVEIVSKMLEGQVPNPAATLLRIVANDGASCIPVVLLQSEIEHQWLRTYFKTSGFADWYNRMETPVMLTRGDLKTLYLLQTLEKFSSQRRIITPGM